MKLKIIPFVFILLSLKLNAQEVPDSIILKHLEVSGIQSESSNITDFIIEGEILQNNVVFPIAISGIYPDKLRMDMTFNGVKFVQVSNGKEKWEYNPMTDSVKQGNASGKEAQEFLERWHGALWKFNSGKGKVKYMGISTIDDIEVFKIEYRQNEQSQVYYIDRYSYLIVRIDDDFVENKMTYYSDYRKIGNYYLPYSLTGYEDGVPVITMRFKNIKMNNSLPESNFKKPERLMLNR